MNTSDFGANILDDGASPTRPAPGESDPAEASTRKRAPRKKKVRAKAQASPEAAAGPQPEPAAPEPAAPPGATPRGPERARMRAETPPADPDVAADSDPTAAAPRGKPRRRKRRGDTDADATEPREPHAPDAPDTDRHPDDRDGERAFADDRDGAGAEPAFGSEADDGPRVVGGDDRQGSLEREGRRRRRRRRGRRSDDDRDRPTHPPELRRDREPRREPESPREHEPARGRPTPRPDRAPTRGPVEVPTPDGETRGARIAILIDLDHVERRARALDSEIAWGRLVTGLGRHRHVVRSVAYATDAHAVDRRSTLVGNGIDLHTVADARTLPVALAVDAMNLASRVDCIVLVPPSDDLEPVARALRSHGIRLESADFIEELESAESLCESHHRLGAECLFEP